MSPSEASVHHSDPPTDGPRLAAAPPEPQPAPSAGHPISPREPLAVALFVVLADICLFQRTGFSGWGALFIGALVLLIFGSTRAYLEGGVRKNWGAVLVVSTLLLLMAVRLIWQGSNATVLAGCLLLAACSLALVGYLPYVLDVVCNGMTAILAGASRWIDYLMTARHLPIRHLRGPSLNLLIPLLAVVVFSVLFINANPDLVDWVRTQWDTWLEWLPLWSIKPERLLFWGVTALLAAGLLWPAALYSHLLTDLMLPPSPAPQPRSPQPSASYLINRNTLVAVSVLFAAYLVFEFQSLWFREFPAGFYYAGYAHQGAAWLTVALAAATLMLSVIFQGATLADPRLPTLRRWARLWSLLNFLLAVAVFHRMQIYVDFNGMTRMRVIGLFGISTVVAGLCLVIWKIAKNRGFVWLIQRQLWALAAAILLYLLTPVDTLIHTYNVRQVLAGDLAPSVQISAHPISEEGMLVLLPLTECEDPTIRDGIRALLAGWATDREAVEWNRAQTADPRLDWITFQGSKHLLYQQLQQHPSAWQTHRSQAKQTDDWRKFVDYAYQWY